MQVVYFCPFCNHYKKKLEICLSEGINFTNWHCWTCNAGGNFLGSLLRKLNSSSQYRERLFKVTGDIKLTRKYEKKSNTSNLSLPAEFKSLSVLSNTPEYKNAITYLTRRNISLVDIVRYNLGLCESGEYKNHIIIPSYDEIGKLNFFMGRRYYDVEGILPHKKPEASMDIVACELLINWNEDINLCEGFFDAMTIRNNAIPLFGKYISKKLQEKLILNKVKRVNMILDNDALADAIKNCKIMMSLGINVHLVILNGKDPSVLGFDKIHSLINKSKKFDFNDLIKYKLKL